jgi:hypothetical protein
MDITLNFAIPSDTMTTATLVKQLPYLTALLKHFYNPSKPSVQLSLNQLSNKISLNKTSLNKINNHTVYVYAASVTVQRSYISLDALPNMAENKRIALQQHLAEVSELFKDDGLIFTPIHLSSPKNDKEITDIKSIKTTALGTLNLSIDLPNPAQFIGRDTACALLRESDSSSTKIIRQFVNSVQMNLYQTPIDSGVNSVWCCNKIGDDALTQAWLNGGINDWGLALCDWDNGLNIQSKTSLFFKNTTQLQLIFSDYSIIVPLKRRRIWQFWQQPINLVKLLEMRLN